MHDVVQLMGLVIRSSQDTGRENQSERKQKRQQQQSANIVTRDMDTEETADGRGSPAAGSGLKRNRKAIGEESQCNESETRLQHRSHGPRNSQSVTERVTHSHGPSPEIEMSCSPPLAPCSPSLASVDPRSTSAITSLHTRSAPAACAIPPAPCSRCQKDSSRSPTLNSLTPRPLLFPHSRIRTTVSFSHAALFTGVFLFFLNTRGKCCTLPH